MKNKPIAPIFLGINETPIKKPKSSNDSPNPNRKTRFDKTATMKFPVSEEEHKELRRMYSFLKDKLGSTSITNFTTMILRFGLRHPELLKNSFVYNDTGTYKTVKPNQVEKTLIAGGNGYAVEWGISERKALHRIMFSVFTYLKRGGQINREEVQPIRPTE